MSYAVDTAAPAPRRNASVGSRRILSWLLPIVLLSGCSRDPTATIEAARQLQAKGDYPTAIIELRNLLANEPNNREARRLLARTFLDNGQPGPAEDEIRKLVEQGVDKETLLPELGRALLLQGKHERLVEEVQIDPTRSGPEYAAVATPRALAHIALGNPADAKAMLERVLTIEPNNPDALMGLAGLTVGERRFDDAEKLVDRAIEASPRNVDAWLLKGDMNRLRDKPDQAIAAYTKVLEMRPDSIVAHMHLASLHIDRQKFDEAGKHVEAVRQRRPNDPMANYLFALVEFRKRNYTTAQKVIAQSLQQNPAHTPMLLLGGAVELATGSNEAAIAHLRNLLDKAPGSILARRMLAVALLRSGQTQRALETIDQLLGAFPGDAALLMLAGEAHLQNNDLTQAAQYLERAAKADPASERARTGLNVARLMSGQTDRAIAELESNLKLESSGPQLELVYIATLLQRRQFDKVLSALQAADQKQPNNPILYNMRAAALIGKGDTAAARRSLENALALNPRFVPAAINLANLEMREGNPRQARRRLESILERDAANQQALDALVGLGPRIGADSNTLIDWLERARRANPAAARPVAMLAEQHLGAGKVSLALKLANEAFKINPDGVGVLEVLAAAQLAAGEVGPALGTYSRLAVQNPKSPAILHRLAVAQAMSNNAAGATLTLRKALALEPNHVDSLVLLGQIDLRANRPDSAQRIGQQLQKTFPKLAAGHMLEGDALVALGKAAAAAPFFETAARLGERSAALAIKRHGALTASGRAQEAQAVLDGFMKANPRDVTVRAYLADSHLFAGRFAAAVEHYQHVLQSQPENALVLNNLAWASYKLKDKRAREFAERAVKLAPENPVVLDTTGWLLVEEGFLERGVEVLQRAVTLAPDARDTRYHLAQAFFKLGNFNRARRELTIALQGTGKFENEAEAREMDRKLKN